MTIPKKQGYKNPLSKTEIAYYIEQLSSQYQIGKQLGLSGAHSSAYLLIDKKGRHFALKIPNNPEKLEDWMNQQKKSIENRDVYVGNYKGPICVPKTIQVGKDFIVEELAKGVEFTDKVYQSLSLNDRRKIAKDFAEFLSYSHQRTLTGLVLPPTKPERISYDQIFDYYSTVLSEDQKKEFRQMQKSTESDQPDNFEVLVFGDYRSQNVLWDSTNKKLSVIDFDLTKMGSIYNEFTPSAAASYGMSYKFLRDVIHYYNMAPKQHPIQLDPQTVERNCIMGIYHEMGRCGISAERSPEQYAAHRISLIQNVKDGFSSISQILKSPKKKELTTKLKEICTQRKRKMKHENTRI